MGWSVHKICQQGRLIMLKSISDTIKKYNMISHGDEVVVGLSGGADSVCLLLTLSELKSELGITVSALHVNHCLRGDESDRDEQFCIDLCQKKGIPIITGRFDVLSRAKADKTSTELAARDIRYEFFKEHTKGKKLATAHNANDNAETVIFNLTRGTGIKGISGIPPCRENIIRPLIETTREQIEAYLNEKKQPFVTDSTNLTDDYTRNRIRHNVIPVLLSVNSSLFGTISTNSDNFRLDNSFIEEETDKAWENIITDNQTLHGLNAYHKSVRHRCIARFLSLNNIEFSSKRISEIDDICTKGGKINLTGNIYILSRKNTLTIEKITPEHDDVCFEMTEGENLFRNRKVTVTRKSMTDFSGVPSIDPDKISGTAVIRNRRSGDRIRLYGKSFTSSVKKLLSESTKVSERDNVLFIADDFGPIYIEGIGISSRTAATSSSSFFLDIQIQ